jgi:hypothetical protein
MVTELRSRDPSSTASNVRVVTIDEAVTEARRRLDDFEQRYGVSSDRLAEAFTDATGELVETGAFLLWTATFERWRTLRGSPAAAP